MKKVWKYIVAVLITQSEFLFSAHKTRYFRLYRVRQSATDVLRRLKMGVIFYAHRFCLCFSFSSMASCLAARIAAFAMWMPKKSSSVSLRELRAAIRPTP